MIISKKSSQKVTFFSPLYPRPEETWFYGAGDKKQARDNLSIAIRMASKTEDVALALLNTLGEIKGIKDEAENNKILIESK